MPPRSVGLVQGTLDMLILRTLLLEPMHAYLISGRIEQISRSVFEVNPGSLIPALNRLERAGYLDSEWRSTVNNRRAKYYKITNMGRKKLYSETRDWENQSAAIARILNSRWREA